MKKPILYSLIFLFISIFCISIFLFLKTNKSVKKNEPGSLTITNTKEYKEVTDLFDKNKLTEAEAKIEGLEKNETSMYNLAQLKLKKNQILLAKKDYQSAVNGLELILSNPRFPKEIKSRAMENVFSYYFASGENKDFYNIIFSSLTFSPLRATSTSQSIYNYASYGYKIYPTTLLGATVIYGKLEHYNNTPKEASDLKNFTTSFFDSSDHEIEHLLKYDSQETLLLNIYTERARVLHKTTKRSDLASVSKKLETELFNAILQAKKRKDPFYIFYTTYNYIDYAANSAITPRTEVLTMSKEQQIFSITNVKETWYHITIKNSSKWSDKRKESVKKISPELFELIMHYK
jgi:hypothetical protein